MDGVTTSPPHATPEPIGDEELVLLEQEARNASQSSYGRTYLRIIARLRAAEARADKAEQNLARFTVNANNTLDEAEARAAGLQEEIAGMVEQVRFAAHVMTENEALKARAAQAERDKDAAVRAARFDGETEGYKQVYNAARRVNNCEENDFSDKRAVMAFAERFRELWASRLMARDHARTAKDREP